MLTQKAKEILIQHYAANTLGDGHKITNLTYAQRLHTLVEEGAAIAGNEFDAQPELTREARDYLHSGACKNEAIRRRNALYK